MSKFIEEKTNIHNDEYYYSIIRKNLKIIRKELGYTQQDIADMIGSTRQFICDIENEHRYKHITIALLGRIADALEIDIAKFFEK